MVALPSAALIACSAPVEPVDAPEVDGLVQVMGVGPHDSVGHVRIEMAPSGPATAWLAVVGGERQLWAALPGAAPRRLDDGDPYPIVATARDPIVAVDGDRVALTQAMSDGGTVSVGLWSGTLDDLGPMQVVATAPESRPVDQPWVAFEPTGPAVTYKEATDDLDVVVVRVVRADGTEQVVDNLPGTACPCCSHTLQFDADGTAWLTARTEVANVRDIHISRAFVGEGFTELAKVSDTAWWLPFCPFEGPELAFVDNGSVAAWADETMGESRVWTATSVDGVAWTTSVPLDPEGEWGQTRPRLAAKGSDVVVVLHEPDAVAWRSADAGLTWSRVELPLAFHTADVAFGADGPVLIGAEETKVWRWDLPAL